MKETIQILHRDEILTLIIFTFAYLAYFFSYKYRWVEKLAVKHGDTEQRKEFAIHIPRFLGFLLLGAIPFLIAIMFFSKPVSDYGFTFIYGKNSFVISLVSIAVFVLAGILRSGKGIDTSYYPQVRIPAWDRRSHAMNIVSWVLYILGYEFMLRGLMFFTCLHAFGLIPAIIINSVIYSLIHIFKGKGEAFGAFFLGIAFCLLAYYTNSFLLPFVLHVTLAIGNDLKAIKASENNTESV